MTARTPNKEPVHQEDGKWFFWDETWSDRYGPYDTEKICRDTLQQYCIEVLGCEDTREYADD